MNFEQARSNMLTQQIRANHVNDDNLLFLIESTPREFFVQEPYTNLAFADINIPIGHDQVMMRPSEETRMLQALMIEKHQRVLEIGTGTGYVTALLAKQAGHVDSIDIFSDFSLNAQNKLQQLHINNVTFQTGDASKGWQFEKLYDVIVFTASTPLLPKVYLEQLTKGGKLFTILGEKFLMRATIFSREQSQHWSSYHLFETNLPAVINAPQTELFKF